MSGGWARRGQAVRGLFRLRAHGGWRHVLCGRLGERLPAGPWRRALLAHAQALSAATDRRAADFDARHGTETLRRHDVFTTPDRQADSVWGYGAVNEDFFHEILRAVPTPLDGYSFVDVGAGKGAAVLMASQWPFRRLIGVELHAELLEVARRNQAAFEASTGRAVAAEWVAADFFTWTPPDEPLLLFFNNPFPEALTLRALAHLTQALTGHRHPVWLAFRKMPRPADAWVQASGLWRPTCLTPYWRLYRAGPA